jgi:hypothetical protein
VNHTPGTAREEKRASRETGGIKAGIFIRMTTHKLYKNMGQHNKRDQERQKCKNDIHVASFIATNETSHRSSCLPDEKYNRMLIEMNR